MLTVRENSEDWRWAPIELDICKTGVNQSIPLLLQAVAYRCQSLLQIRQ